MVLMSLAAALIAATVFVAIERDR